MSYISATTYPLVIGVSNVTERDNGTYVVHSNNFRIGVALVVLRMLYCVFISYAIIVFNKLVTI